MAPKNVEFFDKDWKYIGSKEQLVDDIFKVTGISHEHLLIDFRTAGLAQKMSWLANRGTKFPADLAYCMLGILGTGHLRGLYMEARPSQGTIEFLRLQIEIIKKWNPIIPFDESLFAWRSEHIVSSGLLAPAPSCFLECGNIVYDPNLAKLRHGVGRYGAATRSGSNIGIFFDNANNMSFVALWILPVPFAEVVFLITCGILAWVTLIPEKSRQNTIRHRDVPLNCWSRGKDGQLCTQKIRMEKTKVGTWQRVDCGVLVPSSSTHIYPSKAVAAAYPILLKISSAPATLKP